MKKHYTLLQIFTAICFLLLLHPLFISAQGTATHDTSYYKTYPGTLTGRVYFLKKYTSLILPDSANGQHLQYKPNTKMNLGFGATYRNLSLNIAYGFGFMNQDEDKGETKGIDIRLHFYPNKWAGDALVTIHKGLYLYPQGYASAAEESYFYRPDVRQTFIGLSAFRVVNQERFSYNAAMVQNELQIKSAGSLLLGGQVSFGAISADSALITKEFENGTPSGTGISRISFFSVGPGAGYAYTVVIDKHFFATGSMIGLLGLNFSTEEGLNDQQYHVQLNPAVIYKAAVGYNNKTWNISANWAANALWITRASAARDFSMTTGSYRIILAKRIGLKKH